MCAGPLLAGQHTRLVGGCLLVHVCIYYCSQRTLTSVCQCVCVFIIMCLCLLLQNLLPFTVVTKVYVFNYCSTYYKAVRVCVYYCSTYYKAVRGGGPGCMCLLCVREGVCAGCVCVYYCSTYYKAVRVGEEDSGGHVLMTYDEPRLVWTRLTTTH